MAEEGDESNFEEQYQRIIEWDPSWREEKNKIKQELLGERPGTDDEIGFKIREGIETQADHDELLQSTISVFDPRGEVCQESGWRIYVTEPLHERGLRNPDALIGNPDQDWAILVECKTGLSRPGKALEQLYEAADAVRNNRSYLSEKTDLTIEHIDCVLCVPSQYDQHAAETVAQYERDGNAEEEVFIWRLNRFSGETLQLYDDVDTRNDSGATHDHRVTEFLSGDGVRISGGSEITPQFFPSSHLANIIEVAFSEILWNRELADDPLTTFNRDELNGFLSSEDNMLHYSADTIGERICNEIIDRLLSYDLIEPYREQEQADNTGVFEYRVDGRTMETIKANLTEGYVEEEIDIHAEKEARVQTVNKFHDESGRPLDEF